MKILTKSALAVGLVFTAASCGSDSKSSDTTTAAATAPSANPADTTADTAAADTTDATEATSAITATGAVTVPSIDVGELGPIQAEALTVAVANAAAFGFEFDLECLSAVLAQMSDADAQLVADSGVDGTPTLSPAGEALSSQAELCVVGDPTATSTVSS